MPLRTVLLGTGSFALPPFRAVLESPHDVVAVYTQPERSGRGHHRHVNPVRVLAEEHGIPVHQPERVNAAEVLDQLTSMKADLFVVAAYGQILSKTFLAIPRLGAFNLHGSLLPRHRGAAPVQYSIRCGDELGGVTMFQIEPALDSGPMVGKVSTPIGKQETSGELMQRLADLSGPLTLNVMEQMEAGTAIFETQDESQVTLAPKISKEEGVINWSQSANEIHCHVRAMQPWPRASSSFCSDSGPLRCLLVQVEPESEADTRSAEPGQVLVTGRQLRVATGSGSVLIRKIQPQGKKVMDAAAFSNGYRVTTDSRFE